MGEPCSALEAWRLAADDLLWEVDRVANGGDPDIHALTWLKQDLEDKRIAMAAASCAPADSITARAQ